jgi:hypothetical protein
MRCPHLLAAIALIGLASKPAVADYIEIAPVRPLTMSDPAGLTMIGLEFQFTKWNVPQIPPLPEQDFTSLTFNLTGDFTVAKHWVLLARLPMSDVSVDDNIDATPDDCCKLALGNLTLGARGLWATELGSTSTVIGFDLTLSLPTASDGANRGGSAAAGAFAHLPHDPGLYAPNTTTGRFTGLSQLYGRYFLLQAEAGFQLFYFDEGDDDLDTGIRLALAAGVRATYKIAILAELNALILSSDLLGDDTVTSLDLGIRYNSLGLLFGARAYVPIDSQLRDLDMIGFGLDIGARF